MNNLLQQGDFHIFSFDKKKYVFLSGSQQILEISNPTMDAYFKRCAGRDDGNTLGDTTIDKVTETLKSLCTVPSACCEKQKQDMLTLNITHGCNMSCKYCFASTLQDRKSVMSLSVARNAIANMLEGNPDLGNARFFGEILPEGLEISAENRRLDLAFPSNPGITFAP